MGNWGSKDILPVFLLPLAWLDVSIFFVSVGLRCGNSKEIDRRLDHIRPSSSSVPSEAARRINPTPSAGGQKVGKRKEKEEEEERRMEGLLYSCARQNGLRNQTWAQRT